MTPIHSLCESDGPGAFHDGPAVPPRCHPTHRVVYAGLSGLSGLAALGGVGRAAGFNYYVSAAGNDANPGTRAAPLLTLAQAKVRRAAAGGSQSIALRRGDTWREGYDEQGTAITGTTIGAYGVGAPPIVSGAVVVSSWSKTGGRTNVYESSNPQDTTSTNRAVVVVDGLLSLTRVASVATCDATPGSYYNADASTGTPLVTYIHAVGSANPNADGKVYEVCVREVGVRLSAGGVLSGLEVGPAMSNNGAVEAANVGSVSATVCRYGTKHNGLNAGGVWTDTIALYVDGASASELGVIPYVAYANDATGRAYSFTRSHFYEASRSTNGVFFSHSNSDPAWAFTTGTLNQCVVRHGGSGTAFQPNAGTLTLANCAGVLPAGTVLSSFADVCTVTRLYGQHGSTAHMTVSGLTVLTPQVTWTGCAVYVSSTNRAVQLQAGSTHTFTRCTFAGPSTATAYMIGFAATPTGTVTVNRCVLQGLNTIQVPTGGTYVGDYNVFVRPPGASGPFASYNGTNYNLSSNLAGWRAATGQDAHSIVLTATPFSGTLANGDFRLTGSALTGAGHDGDAGPNDHWDYNLRAATAGPPVAWPVVPTTLAQARTYIADPTTWSY